MLSGTDKLELRHLNRREYHERDNLLLFSMFQILEDFVETELIYEVSEAVWNENGYKYKYRRGKRRIPELGLYYLRTSNLSHHQEMFFLYTWWKDVGCRRDKFRTGVSKELAEAIIGENIRNQSARLDSHMETFAEQDEDEMMERLIAVRRHMWT